MNKKKEIGEIIKWLDEGEVIQIVYESGTVYELQLKRIIKNDPNIIYWVRDGECTRRATGDGEQSQREQGGW